MLARLRSWWQQIKRHRVAIIVTAIILLVIITFIFAGYWFHWPWTGFFNKTLWDWLELLAALAIPVVVGFGAAWLTTQQSKTSDAENKDNQREVALQSYFDKMSEHLIKDGLRKSETDAEVRTIARVRTLTVLRRLDAGRKGSLLQFLHESNLINKNECIIFLVKADLSNADLRFADLNDTMLQRSNLSGVDLAYADLSGADLRFADLPDADLTRAYLHRADLSHANMNSAYLVAANVYDISPRFDSSEEVSPCLTNLSGADLAYADLSTAYLRGADLSFADLQNANLSGTDLREADLREANPSGADLSGATVTTEQLEKAKSLKGAIMPDGSKHT
jgi:uncharacterized protein YjbI with pentapeptide repeats